MGDAQLVAGAIVGRQECFETPAERHQRTVHALAHRWLGDHAGGDEVVEATFVQACTHLVDFREDASLRSWPDGIALDQVRTEQRREQTVPLADVPESDLPQADDVPVGGRLRDRAAASIGRLPPRQHAVVTLRIVSDLPFKEAARIEGISENSAKVSDHHTVTRLRERLRRG